MYLFSKKRPSVEIKCALCTKPTDISHEHVNLSGCCHNPICPECSSKTFSNPTFCLICCITQRQRHDGTLNLDRSLWSLESYVNWEQRRCEIETFFATAGRMPGCCFFLHWNRYSWKHLNTPEIAKKYENFCQHLLKKTIVHFWTRFCSLRGYPIVSPRMFACSKSFMVYSTHPFFPWVPERRKVMKKCHFGVVSTITKRLLAEKQEDRRFLMQILHRFLAGSC
jgi:hypothetical protein